jgi:hypothetical protein
MDHPAVVLLGQIFETAKPDINRALLGEHDLFIIRDCAYCFTSLPAYCRHNEYHGRQHDDVSISINFDLTISNNGTRLFSFVRHLGRQEYLSSILISRQGLLTLSQ